MSMTRTILPGKRRGRINVPSSKSLAHRELIAAVLSGVDEPIIAENPATSKRRAAA